MLSHLAADLIPHVFLRFKFISHKILFRLWF